MRPNTFVQAASWWTSMIAPLKICRVCKTMEEKTEFMEVDPQNSELTRQREVRRRLAPRRKQRRALEKTSTVATDAAFEAPRQVHSVSMKRHAKERVKRSRRARVRHQDRRCPPSWTCFEHSAPPVLLNDCTQQESSTLPHHSIPERTRIDSRQ